ncbi:hypothetical protein TARUN_3024 [Trichoderma arundinaceum]|uniref:Uncharacterized protein n=1 Tax=Trichoderma arundinaceum TaxID=490622 RepID=A0A395NTE4_TRIAR|nr:hypothetical protein TARUN_3024 [Trichoderma arundinaceum]
MVVRPVKASSLTLLCLRARLVRQMATKSTTSIVASVLVEPVPKIAFISGPLDPSPTYFQEHYARLIDEALEQGHHFVLATSRGIDTLARNYLLNHPTTPAAASRICLFLSEPEKKFRARYVAFEKAGGRIVIAGRNHTSRDEALTRASHYDILRYNTKEECKALYGLKYRERVSGTEKNEVRRATGIGLLWKE